MRQKVVKYGLALLLTSVVLAGAADGTLAQTQKSASATGKKPNILVIWGDVSIPGHRDR